MKSASLLLLFVPLLAQSPAGGGAVKGNFDGAKLGDIMPKPYHIHTMLRTCKGQPDEVYGRSDGVYYACMHGKEVCSKEPGAIPKSMMTAFDAEMREHEAQAKEYRAKLVREGRALAEDPQEDLRLQVARQQARIAEQKKARAEGRLPVTSIGRTGTSVPVYQPEPASAAAEPAAKITEDEIKALAIGTARDEVLKKFGQPYMKISSDFERFTYLLSSGNSAKLEFEGGKLTQVRIVQGH